MTDLIYDYISTGVDMLITAAILSGVVILLRSTITLNNYSANQQASTERIGYYKEFNKYDCTNTLVTADILSAMIYYRYDLQIYVKVNTDATRTNYTVYTNKPNASYVIDGNFYEITGNGSDPISDPLTIEYLRNAIKPNYQFKAFLYEDSNAPAGNLSLKVDDAGKTIGTKTLLGAPSVEGYGGSLITGLYFETGDLLVFS